MLPMYPDMPVQLHRLLAVSASFTPQVWADLVGVEEARRALMAKKYDLVNSWRDMRDEFRRYSTVFTRVLDEVRSRCVYGCAGVGCGGGSQPTLIRSLPWSTTTRTVKALRSQLCHRWWYQMPWMWLGRFVVAVVRGLLSSLPCSHVVFAILRRACVCWASGKPRSLSRPRGRCTWCDRRVCASPWAARRIAEASATNRRCVSTTRPSSGPS